MHLIDDELGPRVTDEEKYQEILNQRKQRKAGEQLYDFLERQVAEKMRIALKEPLHNISDSILNRVISKSIQADLKKYKMGKRGGNGTTSLRDRTRSPNSKRNVEEDFGERDTTEFANISDLSKEVSQFLSTLSSASSNKMSLIKMQVIKCDENTNNFKRMRQCFNHGDLDEADRVMAQMEESNHQLLLDLQNEISDGHNIVQIVSQLCESLKREKRDSNSQSLRGRSPGGYAQTLRNRSTSANRGRGSQLNSAQQNAHPDYTKYDSQIAELRRNLHGLEGENQKLRITMREMVEDYTRQLELRDETIKRLESHSHAAVDDYKHEALQLREKLIVLNREIDILNGGQKSTKHLKDEIDRLNRILYDKDRQIEQQMVDQKNEWAQIYGNQKQTVDKLQRDIALLVSEKAQLQIKLEQAEKKAPNFGGQIGPQSAEFQETTKRLKKRELECQALWDTLKDLRQSGKQIFDISQMLEVLSKRALDTKANRKLDIK